MLDSSSEIEECEPIIMCIIYNCRRIVSTYYKINEQSFYTTNEILDSKPEFLATKSLIRELNPKHLVTLGTAFDDFVKNVTHFMERSEDGSVTVTTDNQNHPLPPNLTLLSPKEYSYNKCEFRVKSLKLASEPDDLSDEEHNLFLHSLINFQSKLSVHTLGALLKFLERSWNQLCEDNDYDSPLSFQHIYQTTLKNNVYMDQITFNALQIFQKKAHDAGFKFGRGGCGREGATLYRFFSQHCKTKIGQMRLRQIMLNPINNIDELNKRLDFLQYVMRPNRLEVAEMIRDIIKNLYDVNAILGRIQYSRGTKKDWEHLFKTISFLLSLNESVMPYIEECRILHEFTQTISIDLHRLFCCINNAIDFRPGESRNRPFIKEGLDENLDRDKMVKENIAIQVNAAAKIVAQQLPSYLDECTMIFLPNVGHCVMINIWAENCDRHELEPFGFQFIFELNNCYHYKNPICQELDRQFRAIETKIIEHENRIISRVADFIMKHNHKIRVPLHYVAYIDGLLAMASASSEKSYIRPTLNLDNITKIIGGKHPLLELHNNNFVANDYCSGGGHTKMKIITGPNSSGKSIYLKQVAVLIYLAHIGCYIPAESANVAVIHSIHSRLHATESASLNLSAFMIDLTQMSQALYNAKRSSLILMDEFGRGTSGSEGLALLMGALNTFLKMEENCPHVLVTTHLSLHEGLITNPLVDYMAMDYIRDETTNHIVFLFKLGKGRSSSYALDVARLVGLDDNILQRAAQFFNDLENITPYNLKRQKVISKAFLKRVSIPDLDE